MGRSLEKFEPLLQLLPSIFKAINELRMAIGEKILSADLDIIAFEYDRTYDPAKMNVAYSASGGRHSSGKQTPEVIVGTVGIGLKKLITERSRHRSAKDSDVQQYQILIPAEIVLKSTFDKALGPIQNKKKLVENTDGANQDGRD